MSRFGLPSTRHTGLTGERPVKDHENDYGIGASVIGGGARGAGTASWRRGRSGGTYQSVGIPVGGVRSQSLILLSGAQ